MRLTGPARGAVSPRKRRRARPRFSGSTEIQRPPELVWRAIATPERWLEGYLETPHGRRTIRDLARATRQSRCRSSREAALSSAGARWSRLALAGEGSSAVASASQDDASVESHGYQQSARRCCLATDAGARRASLARRRTPPSSVVRSGSPRHATLARERRHRRCARILPGSPSSLARMLRRAPSNERMAPRDQ